MLIVLTAFEYEFEIEPAFGFEELNVRNASGSEQLGLQFGIVDINVPIVSTPWHCVKVPLKGKHFRVP